MGFAGIAVGAAMVSFLSTWHHRLLGLYYWDWADLWTIFDDFFLITVQWINTHVATQNKYTWFKISHIKLMSPSGRPEAHLWVHDLQLLHASHRPGHQLCGKDLLHVRRSSVGAHRLQRTQWSISRRRCTALAVLCCMVRSLTPDAVITFT